MAPEPTNRPAIRQRALGTAPFRVEFGVRPAFDFLVSAEVGEGEDADILPEHRQWLVESRASLTAEQRETLQATFGQGKRKALGMYAADLIARQPQIRTATDLLASIEALPPVEVARFTVDEVLEYEGLTEHEEGALRGDPEAIAAIQAGLSEEIAAPVIDVVRDPERWKRQLSGVLGAWYQPYRTIEPQIRAILDHDAARQSGRGEAMSADELVEQATNGIRLVGDPTIRTVYLSPGYFNRPYNYLFTVDGGRIVVYPVSDQSIEAAEGQTPPPAVVRLYRALGDETRLRILRLLRERDRYLTEIATEIELSKPTVKHHLSMLRAAGLVTMTEEGSLTYYSLRRQRLAEGGAELERYLA